MNTRRQKSRSSSARGGRGKEIVRQLSTESVYTNHRFMQSVGTLVGLPVQVVTKTKEVFEGIFTAFSPNFHLVLDFPHIVTDADPSVISNPDSIKRKMIFRQDDIVVIKATNVDMEFATRGVEQFAVDSQISKHNGRVQERELEPWHGGETSTNDLGLGDESANGWDADDMFKKNEEKYGVQTTYNPDLEGYTTPLQKKNTKEYKEQEARALKIASEIEHSPMTQARSQLENGEDEEEKFSAVIRPDQGSSGKYVAPQRRKFSGGSTSKPPPRGTPSPQSGGAPVGPISGGRYSNHSNAPSQGPSYPSSQQGSSTPPSSMPLKQQPPLSSKPPQPSQPPPQSMPPPIDAIKISESRDSRKHESYRENKENFHDVNTGSHHSQPSFQHSQSYYPSNNELRRSEPREQREPRKPRNQKDEQFADLRKFGQDFNLTEHVDNKKSMQHQQVSHAGPPPQQVPYQSNSMQAQSHNQYHTTAPIPSREQQPPSQTREQSHPQPNPHQAQLQNIQQQQHSSSPATSHITPTQQLPPPSPHSQQPLSEPPPPLQQQSNSSASSQPPSTPQESKEEEKVASAISNSKLNPNAKEFVFNPNAKPFSPRSPSTSTPSRPQTPQISMSHPPPGAGAGINSVTFGQNMLPAYVMAPNLPVQPAPPRFPKRVGNQRPDYTSSMQVAAATGSPLLAPSPITAPHAISAVQLPQNMMAQTGQPYQYPPMMVRIPSQGIPMMPAMVATSLGGMYHQGETHQNSQGHNAQHIYVGPTHTGVTPHQPHPSTNPGPHPGQPPTPQGPTQLPAIPNQTPTPGPTPTQAWGVAGHTGAPMGAQPTIPQHMPQHSPHTAQSPHNQYMSNHALAAVSASHHGPATQLVVLPPHMTHMIPPGGPPHSGAGHAASSIAGYTPTSAGLQSMNHGHQVHYIPAGAQAHIAGAQAHIAGAQAHIPIVHPNQ